MICSTRGSQGRRPTFAMRARRIRLLTLDVDGVLTDGRIYVDDAGREFKAYPRSTARVSDAPERRHRGRMDLWQHRGVDPPARCPPRCRARAARRRAQGRAVEQLRAALNVPADACAHVGDDLPDVPLLAACGAGRDGAARTGKRAPSPTWPRAARAAGAVREVAELILFAQDRLAEAESLDTCASRRTLTGADRSPPSRAGPVFRLVARTSAGGAGGADLVARCADRRHRTTPRWQRAPRSRPRHRRRAHRRAGCQGQRGPDARSAAGAPLPRRRHRGVRRSARR